MREIQWHNGIPYDEDGQQLDQQIVLKRSSDIVRVFDPRNNKRNTKHIKVRAARAQKRAYEKLTIEEKGFVFSILPFLEWETNIVIGDGRTGEKGKPLIWSDIETMNHISRPTRKKITDSLIEKKVIGFIEVRGKRAAIVLNPQYALRGVKPDDALKQVFDFEFDVEGEEEEDD